MKVNGAIRIIADHVQRIRQHLLGTLMSGLRLVLLQEALSQVDRTSWDGAKAGGRSGLPNGSSPWGVMRRCGMRS